MLKKLLQFTSHLKQIWFLYQYKKHLIKRIEKNDFGRREEW
mgnify:CR=1 FL=1